MKDDESSSLDLEIFFLIDVPFLRLGHLRQLRRIDIFVFHGEEDANTQNFLLSKLWHLRMAINSCIYLVGYEHSVIFKFK